MQFELLVSSMGLLGTIAIFLVALFMLWGIFSRSGRGRTLSLLGFLVAILAATGWLVVDFAKSGIISLTDWNAWGRYVDFGVRGIWMFLLLIYVIMWGLPDFLSQRKWAVIIFLIVPIIYEILMYGTFAIDSITFGPAWLATGLVLAILYMAIIPLYATVVYTRQDRIRGTSGVIWIWLAMVGLLVWFLGELVLGISQILQLPGWNSWFSAIGATIASAHVIGWFLLFIGFALQARTSQAGTS
ncbi:MAG: hypothetical protein ACFFB7_05050 [Candidatus Sifarchaeia archaeon]